MNKLRKNQINFLFNQFSRRRSTFSSFFPQVVMDLAPESFYSIPFEILVEDILSHLEVEELGILSNVCSLLSKACLSATNLSKYVCPNVFHPLTSFLRHISFFQYHHDLTDSHLKFLWPKLHSLETLGTEHSVAL